MVVPKDRADVDRKKSSTKQQVSLTFTIDIECTALEIKSDQIL